MTVWVKSHALWKLAMRKASFKLPKFTKAFWRKVIEIYEKAGGKFLEDFPQSGEEGLLDS